MFYILTNIFKNYLKMHLFFNKVYNLDFKILHCNIHQFNLNHLIYKMLFFTHKNN